MARTKQTARNNTAGRGPRKKLATKVCAPQNLDEATTIIRKAQKPSVFWMLPKQLLERGGGRATRHQACAYMRSTSRRASYGHM